MRNHSSPRSSVRVALIDDDPVFGARASRMLEIAGFVTRFHRGPFGSLQVLREHACEVVLLDIGMPKLDGPLVSRLIRETFGSGIRIVLCSNMEPATLERIATTLDADGFVPKAFFEEGKIDEIAAILRAKRDSSRPKAIPTHPPSARVPSVAPPPTTLRHLRPAPEPRLRSNVTPPPSAAQAALAEEE